MNTVLTNQTFKLVRIQKFTTKIYDLRARRKRVFKNFVVEHFLMTVYRVHVAAKIFKHFFAVGNFTYNVVEIPLAAYRNYRTRDRFDARAP